VVSAAAAAVALVAGGVAPGLAAPATFDTAAADTAAFDTTAFGRSVPDTAGFGGSAPDTLLSGSAGSDSSAVEPWWSSDSLLFEDFPEEGPDSMGAAAPGVFYQPDLSFNRVDGWTPGVRFGVRPAEGWFPRFGVRVAAALHRHPRGLYELEIAQPVLPGRRLLLGAQVRRASDDEDGGRVGAIENSLSSFFFRFDYQDYFVRDGLSLFAEGHPLPRVSATAVYADHQYRSLAEPAPDAGTVFRHKSPWRANPGIDEGRMRSVIVQVVLDGRDDPGNPRRGAWLRLETEASGPRLESDFTFTRYEAEARGYVPLTFGMDVKLRLLLGTTGAGALPYQKEFAVGGISTLRAHSYKYFRGDHVFLANAEYGVLLWRGRQRSGVRTNVKALGFLDVGQAWQGPAYDLARRQMAVDAGLGLGLSDDRVRVYAARDLSAKGSGILWTVRLARPF
jgi:hypothetical protein